MGTCPECPDWSRTSRCRIYEATVWPGPTWKFLLKHVQSRHCSTCLLARHADGDFLSDCCCSVVDAESLFSILIPISKSSLIFRLRKPPVNPFRRCSWHECGNFLHQSAALWEFYQHISPGWISPVSDVKGRSVLTGKQTSCIALKKCCFVFGLHEKQNSVIWTWVNLNWRDAPAAQISQKVMFSWLLLCNFWTFLLLAKRLKTFPSVSVFHVIFYSVFVIISSNFSSFYYILKWILTQTYIVMVNVYFDEKNCVGIWGHLHLSVLAKEMHIIDAREWFILINTHNWRKHPWRW